MMSPLPQGQLVPYIVQGDDEPFPQGQLAMYAMQGNKEPLTTMGDWATT